MNVLKMARMKRVITILVAAVVLLGILAAVILVVGPQRTWTAIQQAGPAAFAADFGLLLVYLFCHTFAWWLLCHPVGHHVRFHRLALGTTMGFAVNYVTPSMYIGGETVRALYVSRTHDVEEHHAIGTVILAKYLEFLAFVLVVGVGVGVCAVQYWDTLREASRVILPAMFTIAAILFATFIALCYALICHKHPIENLAIWLILRRIFRRFLLRRRRRIREMEDRISRTFTEEGRWAYPAAFVLLIGFAVLFIRPLVFFYFLTGTSAFTFSELCLIFVLTQLFAALQILPGSIGIFEGGRIGIFALVGKSAGQVTAHSLVIRASEIIIIGLAFLIALFVGIRLLPGKKPAPEEKATAVEPAASLPVEAKPGPAERPPFQPEPVPDRQDKVAST